MKLKRLAAQIFVGLYVLTLILVACGTLLVAFGVFSSAVAAPEERGRYNAHETVRRAQVGTFSQRLAPAPRREVRRDRREPSYECRRDYSQPLGRTVRCEPVEGKKWR